MHAVMAVPPRQLPFWHVSPLVQAFRSLHGAPFITDCVVHWPVAVSHTPTKQPWLSEEQSLGMPPWQLPIVSQVLASVHKSAGSTHGWPALPGSGLQRPSPGSHLETWKSFGTGSRKQSF